MIYRIISRMSNLCVKFYTKRKFALVHLFDSYEPTDNNRITPVFDLSLSSESQELTRGLHEPAAAK